MEQRMAVTSESREQQKSGASPVVVRFRCSFFSTDATSFFTTFILKVFLVFTSGIYKKMEVLNSVLFLKKIICLVHLELFLGHCSDLSQVDLLGFSWFLSLSWNLFPPSGSSCPQALPWEVSLVLLGASLALIFL